MIMENLTKDELGYIAAEIVDAMHEGKDVHDFQLESLNEYLSDYGVSVARFESADENFVYDTE